MLKPDGTTQVTAWGLTTGVTMVEPVTLATTGAYTVFVNPTGGSVGAVTVRLFDVVDGAGTIDADGTQSVVAVTTPGAASVLSVPVSAGERYSLSLTASTFGSSAAKVTVKGPDGAVLLAARTFSSAGTFVEPVTAAAPGNLTVTIDPVGAAVGEVVVQGWQVPDDIALTTDIDAEPLVVGTTTPGRNAAVTFEGGDQRVALRLTSSTYGTSTSAARVSVFRPDGTTLVAATGFGSAGIFVDQVSLTTSGAYRVVVDPQGVATGQVEVALVDLAGVRADAELNGAPVTVTTTSAGQNGRVVFSAAAGQRVAVISGESTYGTSSSALKMSIVGPDGATVTPATSAVTGTFIEPQTILADGAHTLIIDPQSTNVGSVTVSLIAVPNNLVTPIAANGEATAVTLSSPGQNATLELEANAGDVVSIRATGSTFPSPGVWFTLYAPDGSTVIGASSVSTAGTFVEPRTLTQSGTYRVLVDPRGVATGDVDFTVFNAADAAPVTIERGDAGTLTIESPGQNVTAVVPARAGERVALSFSNMTFANAKYSIVGTDGTALTAWLTLSSSTFIDTLTAASDGEFRITVNAGGASIGSVGLTVHAVPPDVTGVLEPGGSVLVTTTPGQGAVLTFEGEQGDRFSLEAKGSTYSASGVVFAVRGPDGATLAMTSTVLSSGAVLTPDPLPVDGTYTVIVNPPGVVQGAVRIAMHLLPAEEEGTLVLGARPVVRDVVTPGQKLIFGADLDAATTYRLLVTGPAASTVQVKGPTGVSLTSRSIGTGANTVAFATTIAGEHTLAVDPNGAAIGSWQVELYTTVAWPVLVGVPTDEWLKNTWVDLSWSVTRSGTLAGWAFVVDGDLLTDPGVTVTTASTYYSKRFTDGVHWVHLRAVMADGSVSPIVHARIGVDSTPPIMGTLRSSSHAPGTLGETRTIELAWDAPEDLSGVDTYSVTARGKAGPNEGQGNVEPVEVSAPHASIEVPSDGVSSPGFR